MTRVEDKIDELFRRMDKVESRQDWLRMWASSIIGGGIALGFVIQQLGGIGALVR